MDAFAAGPMTMNRPPIGGPTPMGGMGMDGGFGAGPSELDPMANPDLLDFLLLGAEPEVGPLLPPDYRPPPRPTKDWVLELAKQDESDHQLWLILIAQVLNRLLGNWQGHFEGDAEAIKDNKIEVGVSNALIAQHNKLCQHGSAMKTAYECPYLDEIDKEEARDKEDGLNYWRRRAVEQYEEATGQDLDWAEFDLLAKCGVLIGLTKLDPQDPSGLRKRLLSPTTTFPTFEGDRLKYVTRVYATTAADAVGTFRDPAGKVERLIYGKPRRSTRSSSWRAGEIEQRKPNDEVAVVEYIDEWWHAVYIDEEEILVSDHGYGECPVTVQYLSTGDQMILTVPTSAVGGATTATTPEELLALGFSSSRQRDRVRKALPFLFHQFRAHDIRESVYGVYLTLLKRMRDRSWIHQRDLISGELSPIETVSDEPGIVTGIGLEDKLTPVPVEMQPQIAQVVAALLAENDAMMGLPRQMVGQNPAAQTTGTALDILTDAGVESFYPVVKAIERYRAREAKRNLTLFRDFEPVIGPWGDKGKGLIVPRRNAPSLRLTAEAIRRTGIDVDVELHAKPNLSRLASAATVAGIIKSNRLASDRLLIELLRLTTDPDREMDRMRIEQFMQVDEMQQTALADWLQDLEQLAVRRGDEESWRTIKAKQKYLDEQTKIAQMMKMRMLGEMAGPPTGVPPGAPPPPLPAEAGVPPSPPPAPMRPPGGETPVNYQGASMPAYGAPAGTEGGRPPMPPPPLPGMRGGF